MVAYTYELARQLVGTGVTVNVVHPGVVRTGFGRDATGLMRFIVMISRLFDITPDRGADTPLAGEHAACWQRNAIVIVAESRGSRATVSTTDDSRTFAL